MPGRIELRDLARPLALITLAYLAIMLVWSVMVPTFRGGDEHVHHDFLRHLTTTWDYPEYDELPVHRRTLAVLVDSPVYPAHAPAAAADEAAPRSERSSWTDLGDDVRDWRFNQLAQHPPLYYVPTAAVLRAIDGDGTAPLDRVVWPLRLLNILALVPVPLLAADIARRFTTSAPVVLAAAAMVVTVPQLAHVGATVSNDPLMILFGSITLAGVARLLTGDRRWATAAVTGVAAGLALLTKGFAVPLVPAVALACLLPLWRRRRGAHEERGAEPVGDEAADGGPEVDTAGILGRGALVAGLALVFGGWWWVRNLVVHRNPQPGVRLRERVEGVEVEVVRFASSFTERFVDSFWGNVGWREAQLPVALSGMLTLALVVAVAAACWRRWERLVLVIPPFLAALMVLSAGWGAYKKTGVSYATQGRYLFTSIAALAALAAVGAGVLLGHRVRRLPAAVLGAGLALQAAALVIATRRYWGGGGLDRVRSLVAFSPLPDLATQAILVVAPLAAVAALVSVWRDVDGLRGSPDRLA